MEEERFNYSINDATRFVDELKDRVHELYDENKRLKNIIKRFEEDLREMYLTFGEFSEEYTEKKIIELKGSNDNG